MGKEVIEKYFSMEDFTPFVSEFEGLPEWPSDEPVPMSDRPFQASPFVSTISKPPQYPAAIPYGYVPFWSAAPLPFAPVSYPQPILPSSAQVMPRVSPDKLRPVSFSLSKDESSFESSTDEESALRRQLAELKERLEKTRNESKSIALQLNETRKELDEVKKQALVQGVIQSELFEASQTSKRGRTARFSPDTLTSSSSGPFSCLINFEDAKNTLKKTDSPFSCSPPSNSNPFPATPQNPTSKLTPTYLYDASHQTPTTSLTFSTAGYSIQEKKLASTTSHFYHNRGGSPPKEARVQKIDFNQKRVELKPIENTTCSVVDL